MYRTTILWFSLLVPEQVSAKVNSARAAVSEATHTISA